MNDFYYGAYRHTVVYNAFRASHHKIYSRAYFGFYRFPSTGFDRSSRSTFIQLLAHINLTSFVQIYICDATHRRKHFLTKFWSFWLEVAVTAQISLSYRNKADKTLHCRLLLTSVLKSENIIDQL